jgi:hypothetical protein
MSDKIWNKTILSGPQKEKAPYGGTEHHDTKPALHLYILYALRYYGKLNDVMNFRRHV